MLATLPLQARVFVATIVVAGTAMLVQSATTLAQGPLGGGVLLVALAAVTGSCMMKLPKIETRFSLSDALVFTSVLLFGPGCAALAAAVDALAASLRFNKRDGLFLSRTLFNITAAAVSIWLPAHAFVGAGGPLFGQAAGQTLGSLALPMVVLVVGYSLLNTGGVAIVLAHTTGARIATVWRENFAWVWITHAWSGMVACAIALYIPHINAFSLLIILAVGGVGYATVRTYLHQVEESTSHVHKLNDLYLATIHALAMAIDAKDQVTHGHIKRVQIYAVGLARALGVTDQPTLMGIEAGALLHDTGKIAVPEHILNKPGKLTAQEYEKMKTHVTIGADILSGIDFPYPVIPYVRHHHENWDGTGYPDGLKSEEIPLGARILSVVDCFDALTSDRPYRRALTIEAAMDILRQRSGNMYDPRVVDMFIQSYSELSKLLSPEEAPAGDIDGVAELPDPVPADDMELAESAAGLEDLPRLAASGLSAEEAAFVLFNRLHRCLRFATAAIYLPLAETEMQQALHVDGPHAEQYRRSEIRMTEGPAGWVAAHGQLLVNANPALDLQGPVSACEVGLGSALVVPFTAAGNLRGALALYADAPEAFTLADARIAVVAATQLSRLFSSPARGGDPASIIQAA